MVSVGNQMRLGSGKYIKTLLLAGMILLLFARLAYLDRDLPPTTISSYVPIDEFYYTIPAFNLHHYGEVNHPVVPFIQDNNPPWNITQNFFTRYTLDLCGNNYYGLRLAPALSGITILLIMYLTLKRILSDDGSKARDYRSPENMFLIFACIYLLSDFSLMVASRVAEPTIFRMLFLVMMIYLSKIFSDSSFLDKKWTSCLLGFLSTAAVLYVYLYNMFIIFGFAAALLIWSGQKGRYNAIGHLFCFIAGSVLCFLTFNFYVHGIYYSNIGELYDYIVPFQNRMGLGIDWYDRLISYCVNFIFIFLTNIFRFNLGLLLVLLMSIPIYIDKLRKYRNRFDVLIASLMAFFLLQSIVINDYPMRKLVMLLPLVVIIITISYKHSREYFTAIGVIDSGQKRLMLYWLSAFMIVICVLSVYLHPNLSGSFGISTGKFMYLNLFVFLIISSLIACKFILSVPISRYLIVLGLIAALVPNLYLDMRYIFLQKNYYFRDAMTDLGSEINGKIVVGGCAYGFRLYNDSVPVLDAYTYTHNIHNQLVMQQYNHNFERAFEEGYGFCSIAFSEVRPNDPFCAEYMYQHGLFLEREYVLDQKGDYLIGIFKPSS